MPERNPIIEHLQSLISQSDVIVIASPSAHKFLILNFTNQQSELRDEVDILGPNFNQAVDYEVERIRIQEGYSQLWQMTPLAELVRTQTTSRFITERVHSIYDFGKGIIIPAPLSFIEIAGLWGYIEDRFMSYGNVDANIDLRHNVESLEELERGRIDVNEPNFYERLKQSLLNWRLDDTSNPQGI